MKAIIAVTVIITMATCAVAFDLGNQVPAKPASNATAPPPDAELIRQGGDTIADAVRIPIPTIDLAGTTAGYADDYDEACPYEGGDAPDVVYSILPESNMLLDVDLCGSQYDTRIWVYDDTFVGHIACNDDFYGGPPCGAYVSKIENMVVEAGREYWIVVDGYGGEYGEYLIDVVMREPCELDCPAGATLEDEPPLMEGYVDTHNGGCASDSGGVMQPITSPLFCGVSGWYLSEGANFRDTDWFLIDIPASGVLEIIGDAALETYMFELGPQDCNEVAVLQNVTIGPCVEGSMTITGEPGSTVWFWVGPTTFASPDGSDVFEYDYVLELNLDVVATENHTWTDVKGLFD